jgi:hypothetical protein
MACPGRTEISSKSAGTMTNAQTEHVLPNVQQHIEPESCSQRHRHSFHRDRSTGPKCSGKLALGSYVQARERYDNAKYRHLTWPGESMSGTL